MLDASLQKYIAPDDARFDGRTLMVLHDVEIDEEPLYFDDVQWERHQGSVIVESAILDGKSVTRERIIQLVGFQLLNVLEDDFADTLHHNGEY